MANKPTGPWIGPKDLRENAFYLRFLAARLAGPVEITLTREEAFHLATILEHIAECYEQDHRLPGGEPEKEKRSEDDTTT